MHFEFETTVHAPLESVFAFFSHPDNLAELMREWPGFRMMHNVNAIAPGAQFWIEANVFGILPVAMGFEFCRVIPNASFEEKMIHGPFEAFVHTHTFSTTPQGTRVHDRLDMTLKWPYGGELMTSLCVAPQIRALFDYRAKRLRALAQAGAMSNAGE